MRFLCLSDIHGHADALAAVLATAERRGYDRVLVAGDLCFPGPQPLQTLRRLLRLGAMCVQGAGDRALATVDVDTVRVRDDHQRARLARLLAVRGELGEALLSRLARLPPLVRQVLGGGIGLTLVHGSPLDPLEPMTHDLDDATLNNMLADDRSQLVLCGGSHLPFDRVIERDRSQHPELPAVTRVINLGSVGEAPSGGSGRYAHATFVEQRGKEIDVEQFVVPLGRAA